MGVKHIIWKVMKHEQIGERKGSDIHDKGICENYDTFNKNACVKLEENIITEKNALAEKKELLRDILTFFAGFKKYCLDSLLK